MNLRDCVPLYLDGVGQTLNELVRVLADVVEEIGMGGHDECYPALEIMRVRLICGSEPLTV
jgi:hypothetical protein